KMPPKKKMLQPTKEEREFVVAWISNSLTRLDCTSPKDPGRVTIRRLNRAEYNNTIRDLVGVDFKPADDFPADDVGYGFDNIGDVLSVSPLLLEKYLSAAEAILDEAIVIADPPKLAKQTFGTIRTGSTSSAAELGRMVSFDAGEYRIRCKAGGDQLGDEPVRVMLRVMGEDVK